DYGTKVFGATQYMNGLITTVAHGKITLQDLSTAMGPILPIARNLGISFSDLAAAMATQTNAGIPAERAATGLRFTMQALENPTKKAKDAMTAMGLNSVTVADEMKKSLPGALQMLYDAALKAGPAGSVPFNRALSDMSGGIRSLSTVVALTGPHMKDFAKNADLIAGSMRSGKGDVQGWALAQTNFNVQMDKAKASVEAAGIKIGTALLPVLSKLAGFIPVIVGYISDFSAHSNVLIPILAGLATVLLVLVVPAVWALAAGVIAATWPALAIGLAIAGLVAIFMHFYQTNAGFKAFIDGLVAGFKNVLSAVGGFIHAVVNAFTNGEEIMRIQHAQKMTSMKITADTQMAGMAQKTIQHMEEQRVGLLKKLDETHDPAKRKEIEYQLAQNATQIKYQQMRLDAAERDKQKQLAKQKELHAQMLEAQKNFFQRFLDMLGTWFGNVFSAIGTWAHNVISAIGGFFSGLGTKVRDILTGIKNTIGGIFSTIGTTIHDKLTDAKNKVGEIFSTIGTTIHDKLLAAATFVSQKITDIENFFKALPGKILAALATLGTILLAPFKFFYDHNTYIKLAVDTVVKTLGDLKAKVGEIFSAIGTTIHDKLTWIKNTVGEIFSAIGTTIHDKLTAIKNFFGTIFSDIGSLVHEKLSATGSFIGSKMSDIGSTVHSKLTDAKNFFGTAFSDIGSIVHSKLSETGSFVGSKMSDIGATVHARLTDVKNFFGQVFSDIGSLVRQGLNNAWNIIAGLLSGWPAKMFQFGVSIVQGLINGIGSMFSALGGAVSHLAGQLGKFLGFHASEFGVPPEGPGHEADKWMPALVNGL